MEIYGVYLWINNLKFYAVHFIVWQVECYQKILKPRRRPLAIPHISLELVSLPHYLHYFWRKIFLLLCSISWPNFNVWLLLLREILGNNFLDFYEKTLVKKKGFTKIVLANKKKPEHIWKYSGKKTKTSKSFEPF